MDSQSTRSYPCFLDISDDGAAPEQEENCVEISQLFSDISEDELLNASQAAELSYLDSKKQTQVVTADKDEEYGLSRPSETDNEIDVQPSGLTERFPFISDQQVDAIVQDSIPQNTRRRNSWAFNTFEKWSIARNNKRIFDSQGNDINENQYNKMLCPIEQMNVDLLNYWVSKFIVEVRKENGEEYPPNSILSLVMGLQSYLRVKTQKPIDFLECPDFSRIRLVLDADMKRLTRKGMGSKSKKAEHFQAEDVEKLWKSKQLGDFNPTVLVKTIFFLNGLHFGLRGGQEHRRLRFNPSQITLHEPTGKPAYLKYTEDCSKTVQGGLKHRRIRNKEVVHHANTKCPERCHVRLFKRYMELCPTTGRDDAFYLQPLKCYKSTPGSIWYSRQPYGINTLSKFVPEMCAKAGLSGYFTNHSLRATTATSLFQQGLDEQLIMDRTGHRSTAGIRSYKRVGEEQRGRVSEMLNDCSSGSGTGNSPTSVQKMVSSTACCSTTEKGNVTFTNCTFNF